MKILQIGNNFRISGGAESVYFNTINLLKDKGHQVVPFSQKSNRNLASAYDKYFVEPKTLWHNRFFSFEARKNLKKLLEDEKPDVAHIHNIIGGISFSILPILKEYEAPVIATVHDFRLLCPAYIFINGKKEICEKCKTGKYYNSILNSCSPLGFRRNVSIATESYLRDLFLPYWKLIDSFIFVSKFQQNKFLEVNADLKFKNYQIYNLSTRFDFCSLKGNYFLYFGRLAREKSIFTMLEAFKELPHLKLYIVGEGELEAQIRDKKSTNVEMLGYKSGVELEKIIKDSSFVIASSECYETNSMVIVESNSFGKPVIGSKIGAISEIIRHGETGFLYESQNVSQLKSFILYAGEMTLEHYTKMAQKAFEFASQKFSADLYYNSLMNVYKETIARKNKQLTE